MCGKGRAPRERRESQSAGLNKSTKHKTGTRPAHHPPSISLPCGPGGLLPFAIGVIVSRTRFARPGLYFFFKNQQPLGTSFGSQVRGGGGYGISNLVLCRAMGGRGDPLTPRTINCSSPIAHSHGHGPHALASCVSPQFFRAPFPQLGSCPCLAPMRAYGTCPTVPPFGCPLDSLRMIHLGLGLVLGGKGYVTIGFTPPLPPFLLLSGQRGHRMWGGGGSWS